MRYLEDKERHEVTFGEPVFDRHENFEKTIQCTSVN